MSQPADKPPGLQASDLRALNRRALVGAVGAALAGPAFGQTTDQGGQQKPATPPGLQAVVPKGYSERFIKVREMIAAGRYDEAVERFEQPPKPEPAPKGAKGDPKPASSGPKPPPPIVSDAYLADTEMGLLAFEGGHVEDAVGHLHDAEDIHEGVGAPTTRSAAVKKGFGGAARLLAGKLTGQEEIEVYHPLDHEVILLLNYLALARLLQGERECYNVTRRCIDQQTDLKAKFDKEIEAYKSKYSEQTSDTTKVTDTDRTSLGNLSDQFKSYDTAATRVPNAYVNPLGDYLAGVIQEIVSREEPALRDNAKIAYQTAARLCGGSPQLAAAAAAMARPRVPPKERVLHVVAGEGFAPERDVMTFGLAFHGDVVLVKVPIFKPVPSAVSRIAVQAPSGQILATLDPIGDFEAIRLRDQHDRIPEIMLGVLTSFLASYFEGRLMDKLGLAGQVLHLVRDAAATPDTRSWLSLPRRFHVARVVLPPKVTSSVNMVSFDAAGRRIASQPVTLLAGETQSFVYARATDQGLQAQAARRLWIDGKLEETAA
ncbi:MAG TPA: hypothetical protein VGG29_20330 [Caulobacteraceae bacterium]